jgi:hypothetical protein
VGGCIMRIAGAPSATRAGARQASPKVK